MSKGTIYRRKNGRWEARISMWKDENGKRVFRSFYGKNREEAEYKAMIAQGQAEEEYVVTEMTVRELVTEWLHVTASRIKESTAANYAKILHYADLPSFHYHSLRHLFATRCVELGFDVKTLSEILGHNSVEVTLNRYIHSDLERKRTCISLLSKCA